MIAAVSLLIVSVLLVFYFNKEDGLGDSVKIIDNSNPNEILIDIPVQEKGKAIKHGDASHLDLVERACIEASDLVKEPNIDFLENFLMEKNWRLILLIVI